MNGEVSLQSGRDDLVGGVINNPMADACVVYWLYDETCSAPENDGYVGITYRLDYRVNQHRKSNKFNPMFSVRILFEGTRDQCSAVERGYRPNASLGWNSASGGGVGRRAAASTREKISRFFKTIPRSKEWRDAISVANKGKLGNFGYRHSEDARKKLSKAAFGNKRALGHAHTEEAKAKMSACAMGNKRGIGNKGKVGRIRPAFEREKISRTLTGTVRPEIVKRKIRQGHLMRHAACYNSVLSFGS